MSRQPYANIHHYDGTDKETLDDDGDPRQGWYFEFIEDQTPITPMIGPYASNIECEAAALKEWSLN